MADMGSIPASAGERSTRRCQCSQTGVYPRERGGTPRLVPAPMMPGGLSPRARGNVSSILFLCYGVGSIPASAGERLGLLSRSCGTRVYPRERGGTQIEQYKLQLMQGLSPRARGNAKHERIIGDYEGSIPASAGERAPCVAAQIVSRVYPRERGGTMLSFHGDVLSQGLSPRARGNVRADRAQPRLPGSIPASAGERFRSRRS